MIILEGTDKSGKTTFLNNLVNFFPEEKKNKLNIVHFGLLPDNWNYCDDYLRYIQSNTILDRFIDSERAYGPVFRNGVNNKLTKENLNKVYRKCSEIGTLVVYCKPDIDETMKRINDQKDLMVKQIDHLEKLRDQFDIIFVIICNLFSLIKNCKFIVHGRSFVLFVYMSFSLHINITACLES